MQRSRRHNPYPLTWEIPLAVADVRGIYEAIWGIPLDPGNFQRKMTGVFDRVENAQTRSNGPGRPAALFTRKRRPSRDGLELTPIEPPFRRIDAED